MIPEEEEEQQEEVRHDASTDMTHRCKQNVWTQNNARKGSFTRKRYGAVRYGAVHAARRVVLRLVKVC